jgi:hypothetical protein
MSFNHEEHYLDEKGFQRHKETHHLIGIEGAPPAKHPDDGAEFPKWVKPHPHHVHRQHRGDVEHVSTPHFTQHHVRRDSGDVTVLVHTPEEEAKALAAPDEVAGV